MAVTLRHLNIFLCVCDEGSMTGAAKKLFMAQPSVSLAIREMEEYYGIKLFDRIAKHLYLTEQGKKMLDYARHISELSDQMEREMHSPQDAGTLRVGTSITIGTFLLPKYVKEMGKRYPDLRIEAVIENSEHIEQYVLKNAIDLGIIEGVAHSPSIESRYFPGDELLFICPPEHPFAGRADVSWEELAGETFLLREKGSAGREIFDGLVAARELNVHLLWESASNQAILGGVAAGLGLSLLPDSITRRERESGCVAGFCVQDTRLTRRFCVIRHKNKYLSKGAKELIAMFCQEKLSDLEV